MAGLVPAIHVSMLCKSKAWMAVTGTATTMWMRFLLPRPALCGERVGVRGADFPLAQTREGGPSPGKPGEVKPRGMVGRNILRSRPADQRLDIYRAIASRSEVESGSINFTMSALLVRSPSAKLRIASTRYS
jgi:hypothetical protein